MVTAAWSIDLKLGGVGVGEEPMDTKWMHHLAFLFSYFDMMLYQELGK